MNAREKEQYLRDYSILKGQGKPFFPYAVAKDGAMACIVLFVIITMAVLFGAELGPKADPTTTTYTPRPEWYFFFLFELLRVIKPPEIVVMATIGVPTIWLVLLLLLPFYDRGPERHPLRRPIAMTAAVATVAGMAYLSVLGALAGSPTEIDLEVQAASPQERGVLERGRAVTAANGCLGCHKIGENGNTLGPSLTTIGDRLGRDAIVRTLLNPTKPMPPYRSLREDNPKQFDELVRYIGSLKEEK
jgi:menaquinol-cytochrome c reductase cytochrome b/c subunit